MEHSVSDSPVYFWNSDDQPYGAFSHWYKADTKDEKGIVYPTVEHYMMYHKALLFGDETVAKEILSVRSPAEVKQAGRRVHGFDTNKWSACREQVVLDGNFLKYCQHQDLQQLLLETEIRQLVEASPEDRIWGIGYSSADASEHRDNWGDNLCGKALEKDCNLLMHIKPAAVCQANLTYSACQTCFADSQIADV